jgi:hypothetical protein
MLSPQELYLKYTLEPCYSDTTITEANGTPYDLPRLLRFLRHLKYPCIEGAPYVDIEPSDENALGIKNTGAGKLGIPYKFLNRIDAEAFSEIQPDIKSGTSHAIRNACDITRACDIEKTREYYRWESRMATEYLEHFGSNSLPDCLMMLGPDIVTEEIAQNQQAPGCSYKEGNIEYFFNCIKNPEKGAAGANFYCKVFPPETTPKCVSCETCNPEEPGSLCCQAKTCVENKEMCCGAPETNRLYFSYLQKSATTKLDLQTIIELKLVMDLDFSTLKHVGILKRKSYGGYGNFIDNSGPNFYACSDDLFLKYFQTKNNFDYTNAKTTTSTSDHTTIERFRTISFIGGDDNTRMNRIKDLLFNGYGVVFMTNVGFPNSRDSTGVAYADRIWYHTFTIIGYDDTQIEYPECVYLVANSWGEWNSGGSPSWGPIPPGSFLVTESHLKGMTKFNHSPSFKGCRSRYCPDAVLAAAQDIGLNLGIDKITVAPDLASLLAIADYIPSDSLVYRLLNAIENNSNAGACSDPVIRQKYTGCASKAPVGECCSGDSSCTPYECSKYQTAFGLLFGLSTSEGFPKRDLNYKQFYPINNYRKLDNTTDLYLNE